MKIDWALVEIFKGNGGIAQCRRQAEHLLWAISLILLGEVYWGWESSRCMVIRRLRDSYMVLFLRIVSTIGLSCNIMVTYWRIAHLVRWIEIPCYSNRYHSICKSNERKSQFQKYICILEFLFLSASMHFKHYLQSLHFRHQRSILSVKLDTHIITVL
jgi:hypothetical protein